MTDQTNIERIVMRRILLIRVLRLVISTAVLAVLTTVAALWGIGKEVWVARIFENAPPDIGNLPNFYLAAFFHTHLIVQMLVVLTFISLMYLIIETVRLLVDVIMPARTR